MQVNTLPMKVALYARVSSEEQRAGQTIDSQIAELERFAMQSGWQIFRTYKDDGWSGAILGRPSLEQLRDDASRALFQAVLVNDVDRLARDVSHLGVIKRDLERHGAQVIFRKLPAEKSPTQSLMVNILGSFAEFERELISDRTRRGRRHKVETRGQYLGCLAPYGFSYTPKNRTAGIEGVLQVNSEEAQVVRKAYEWVDRKGFSARRVRDELDREGIQPRKSANGWARSSVLRILRSEVYTGVWHYNKLESCEPTRPTKTYRYRALKTGRRLRERSDWFRVELPEHLRIIATDQWRRVQRQLDKNRVLSPRNSKRIYLLGGLIRCGGCGRRYVGEPCHGKFYYRCNARCKKVPTIKEEFLNESVWNALKLALLKPSTIIGSITKLNEQRIADASSRTLEFAELEKASQQARDEEARILEAYRVGAISTEQLSSELEKLKNRHTSLEARRVKLDEHQELPSLTVIGQTVSNYCASIANRLETLNLEGKRRLLTLLINEIVFDGVTAQIKGVIPGPENTRPVDNPRETQFDWPSSGRIETMQTYLRGRNTGGIETMQTYHYGGNPAVEFLIIVPIRPKVTA